MIGFPSPTSSTVTLAITGASGSLCAVTMLQALDADPRVGRIHLIASPSALRVLGEELGIHGRTQLAETILGHPSSKVLTEAHENIGAAIASGSYPTQAMVVLPCSMGTLGAIAHGLATNLTERAADVCLKERRPLVLCVRETPLNLIHLKNMAAVTEAGATVFPVTPAFYSGPQTVADIVSGYVQRVLQHIGLPQADAFQWGVSPRERPDGR